MDGVKRKPIFRSRGYMGCYQETEQSPGCSTIILLIILAVGCYSYCDRPKTLPVLPEATKENRGQREPQKCNCASEYPEIYAEHPDESSPEEMDSEALPYQQSTDPIQTLERLLEDPQKLTELRRSLGDGYILNDGIIKVMGYDNLVFNLTRENIRNGSDILEPLNQFFKSNQIGLKVTEPEFNSSNQCILKYTLVN